MDPGDALIVSEVTWHNLFKLGDNTLATHLRLIHSKGPKDENENQPSESVPAEYTSEFNITDYRLLCFTAQTVVLTIRQAE